MCGLAGFFSPHSNINNPQTIIALMAQQLQHRGPDDHGTWCSPEEGIALGHQRLAILDLSMQGHQPMHSHNDRYVIIYNGEIYNYLILKKQLQNKNHRFIGQSDTEVILALVSEYGLPETLGLLTGMFAFALWDKKNKVLHLARDRLGEKPLYYGLVNQTLVFASELKAFRAFPGFQNPIAESSLAYYLQFGYVPAPHSIYENIYKLLPGTYLSLSRPDLRSLPTPRTYWSAIQSAKEGIQNPLSLTDHDAIIQGEALLTSIVQNQMISDVPIGAFLSGGIDSSLIAALMQKNSNRPVKTFTIGFEHQSYNEAHYAKTIAAHLHTDHTELYVDAHQALDVIPKLPNIYDEPFADSSAIPTFLIAALTRQQVTVSLSGDGGDELFGGYNRYLLGQTLWSTLSLLPLSIRFILQKLLHSLAAPHKHAWLAQSRIPLLKHKLHKFSDIITSRSSDELYLHLISQWMNPEMITKARVATPVQFSSFSELKIVEKMMLQDTLCYLPDDIMVKVDRASMAVSLESRAPFLDHHLLEWAWRLPSHMKIRNRNTKWLLKEILAKHIPSALFDRPKMGFAVPLDTWLKGPLRDWAETLLDKNVLQAQGYLHADPILKKWDEHKSGKRNWQSQLWTILMFQAWLNS
jgi:asparagine synthase (glutamine-hydrolysing)